MRQAALFIAIVLLAALASGHGTRDSLLYRGSPVQLIYVNNEAEVCLIDGFVQAVEPTPDGSTVLDLHLECFESDSADGRSIVSDARSITRSLMRGGDARR